MRRCSGCSVRDMNGFDKGAIFPTDAVPPILRVANRAGSLVFYQPVVAAGRIAA